MATHSAFLREEGIDYTLSKNLDKTIGVSPAHFNPNAAFGKVYWVDETTGDDNSNGLTPATAFATIGQAITISNAEVGSYNMNTIYVNAQTYTEDLTTAPRNVNIIAIGAKTRLQGTHVFAANQNWHFWNFWFRDSDGINFTVADSTYKYGWHNCVFENAGATGAIKTSGRADMMVEGCQFLGNPLFTTCIQISGTHNRSVIRNNLIAGTTDGILIDDGVDGYGNLIIGNTIGRQTTDPNSSAQMARGIYEVRADGHSGWMIVNNKIEAVDAIQFGLADTASANSTIANSVVQAGTGVMEDPLT